MPFKSEKQRRYMWANHPDIAQRWSDTYGSTPTDKDTPKMASTAGIKKRVTRIQKKTGMGTHEALQLAVKRAKKYQATTSAKASTKKTPAWSPFASSAVVSAMKRKGK